MFNKIRNRTNTKEVKVGDVILGGYHDIAIQTMTTTKTSDINATIKQINEFVNNEADLVRVAVLDELDAKALKDIVARVKCPIIADIHYNWKFAIDAIKAGVAKIRINPGNIGSKDNVVQIIEEAKKHNTAIRIGINGGSLKLSDNYPAANQLAECAKEWIKFFEKHGFKNIVVSIKHSNPNITYKANMLLAEFCKYPIHLGVTEAGPLDVAIIKSCIGLIPLLNNGIGNTIRVSINGDRKQEIKVCKMLLKHLGFNVTYYNIIACPLCGRNLFNTNKVVQEIDKYLEERPFPITIGIMGCVVNGPGEAKGCDLSICVKDKLHSTLYINDKPIKVVDNDKLVKTLKEEIDKKYNLFIKQYEKLIK